MHHPRRAVSACLILLTSMLLTISNVALPQNFDVVRNSVDPRSDIGRTLRFELAEDLTIGGEPEREHEVFGTISGVVVDSQGNIYVLDHGNCRVHVYYQNGEFSHSFGWKGNGPGELSFPTCLAIDNREHLIVADMSTLEFFDTFGGYITSIRIDQSSIIRSVAVDGNDNLYISSFDILKQNIIHKYSAEGEHLASFCKSFAAGEDIDLRIESTFAGGYIDIDDNDVIYFTQMLPYEIRKYTTEGRLLRRILRENSFMRSPEEYVKIDGENMEFTLPVFSSSILVCENDIIINTVHNTSRSDDDPSTSIIDVFDAGGRLLASRSMDRPIKLAFSDRQSRVYAIDNSDYPKVIRYKVLF